VAAVLIPAFEETAKPLANTGGLSFMPSYGQCLALQALAALFMIYRHVLKTEKASNRYKISDEDKKSLMLSREFAV
jgi:hypothetical protein